jgi:hypothetical protein
MLCKIADLLVEVPADGGMDVRCTDYLYDQPGEPDITITTDMYKPDSWPGIPPEGIAYMESGTYFYLYLLQHGGLMLHSSAVEMDGKAYLFSGPCGMGKSTHTRIWQQTFGEKAQVFNDDKPALRCVDGTWYAYGTPWCGKDGINQNKKVPLAGICFLQQAPENKIRRLNRKEAMYRVLAQTLYKFKLVENLDRMLTHVDALVRQIPVFELENRPEPAAAVLSYETMRRAAEEEIV